MVAYPLMTVERNSQGLFIVTTLLTGLSRRLGIMKLSVKLQLKLKAKLSVKLRSSSLHPHDSISSLNSSRALFGTFIPVASTITYQISYEQIL